MLNQMKVKELRLNYHRQIDDNCLHHQLTFNVCLITCDTIKNGRFGVMVRCTFLGKETF